MPESTDNKHEKLILGFALEVMSLVYASVEPLLDMNVPVVYLLSHVNAGLHLNYIRRVDAAEIRATVADSR